MRWVGPVPCGDGLSINRGQAYLGARKACERLAKPKSKTRLRRLFPVCHFFRLIGICEQLTRDMRKRGNRIHHQRRDPTAFLRAFGSRKTLPEHDANTVALAYHLALANLWRGIGSDIDANQLAYSLNMTLVLCELGVGANFLEAAIAAQNALAVCIERSAPLRRLALDDVSYRAIGEVLRVHDVQLKTASQAELAEAREVIRLRREQGDVIRLREMSLPAI
jgi:hypothetical protein